jgi:probable HAF family extracellular repeat protein
LDTTFASAINNAGDVVGWYTSAGRTHGFFRKANGSVEQLEFPPAVDRPQIAGLNDQNEFTAYYQDRDSRQIIIWRHADGSYAVLSEGPPHSGPCTA